MSDNTTGLSGANTQALEAKFRDGFDTIDNCIETEAQNQRDLRDQRDQRGVQRQQNMLKKEPGKKRAKMTDEERKARQKEQRVKKKLQQLEGDKVAPTVLKKRARKAVTGDEKEQTKKEAQEEYGDFDMFNQSAALMAVKKMFDQLEQDLKCQAQKGDLVKEMQMIDESQDLATQALNSNIKQQEESDATTGDGRQDLFVEAYHDEHEEKMRRFIQSDMSALQVNKMIVNHTQKRQAKLNKQHQALNQEELDIDVEGILSSLQEILNKRLTEIHNKIFKLRMEFIYATKFNNLLKQRRLEYLNKLSMQQQEDLESVVRGVDGASSTQSMYATMTQRERRRNRNTVSNILDDLNQRSARDESSQDDSILGTFNHISNSKKTSLPQNSTRANQINLWQYQQTNEILNLDAPDFMKTFITKPKTQLTLDFKNKEMENPEENQEPQPDKNGKFDYFSDQEQEKQPSQNPRTSSKNRQGYRSSSSNFQLEDADGDMEEELAGLIDDHQF